MRYLSTSHAVNLNRITRVKPIRGGERKAVPTHTETGKTVKCLADKDVSRQCNFRLEYGIILSLILAVLFSFLFEIIRCYFIVVCSPTITCTKCF